MYVIARKVHQSETRCDRQKRGVAGVIASSADGVVWWCTDEKFGGSNDGFSPVFRETEEVRVN